MVLFCSIALVRYTKTQWTSLQAKIITEISSGHRNYVLLVKVSAIF